MNSADKRQWTSSTCLIGALATLVTLSALCYMSWGLYKLECKLSARIFNLNLIYRGTSLFGILEQNKFWSDQTVMSSVVKVVLWSRGAHLTKPGWSKPHTHSNPTNLALFRHKITLYRFNQGLGALTIAGGFKREQGGWAPLPPHFNHWMSSQHEW